MDDHTKLNLAVTRFAGFVSHLPLEPNECDVLEYHDIIKLFEEACSQDLSRFRIAPNRVESATAEKATASSGAYWQRPHCKKNRVEYTYFRGQVRGLIACLMAVLETRPC
jgi:hypothetical protein